MPRTVNGTGQLLRRGVAGASCIISRRAAAALLGVAAAAPYLGDVDAGLTARARRGVTFVVTACRLDFKKSLAPGSIGLDAWLWL